MCTSDRSIDNIMDNEETKLTTIRTTYYLRTYGKSES
jgi:hypothetical protein